MIGDAKVGSLSLLAIIMEITELIIEVAEILQVF